jgi:exodeoxyribonuclease III
VILKLLSYNIRFGGVTREARLAEVIRAASADLVVFQEAIEPRVIQELADRAEYPLWGAKRGHSIAFMSRVPITHYEWHYSGAKHPYLELALPGSEARIFGLHLSAMFSRWSEERRLREIRLLLKGIEKYQQGFHALVGDFNTLAPGEILNVNRMPTWIRALIWVSGRDLARSTIRCMLEDNYVDGFRRLYPDDKGYTFPTWEPHLRLDYVFVPVGFAERLIRCRVIREPLGAALASDHFPLLVEFELEPMGKDKGTLQSQPTSVA